MNNLKSGHCIQTICSLACEHKGTFLGLLFTARVKPEVLNKIVNFEMKKNEVTEDDFASFDEEGSDVATLILRTEPQSSYTVCL